METLSLNLRKTQTELLDAACERRCRARVTLPRENAEALQMNTRFLGLSAAELWLDWPTAGLSVEDAAAPSVEVYFILRSEWFGFRTRGLGTAVRECPRRGRVQAWQLARPLCLERQQQRDNFRVSLADLPPVAAHFTNISAPTNTFVAQLMDLSAGGLGGIASAEAAPRARAGELYWTRFALPEAEPTFEFVVRLMHARPLDERGALLLGCKFCAGEDPARHRRLLACIDRFVAQRQRARLRRPRTATQGD